MAANLLAKLIQTAKSAPGALKNTPGFVGSSIGTTVNAAGVGFSGYMGYQTRGQEYGTGAGWASGIAEGLAFTAIKGFWPSIIAMGVYYGGQEIYRQGRETYKENRQINLGKQMHDPFGSLATMRQRSSHSLQRGRASLGSEARMMRY